MSEPVYRICSVLCQLLASVPVGTNAGLFALLWALVSGQFLLSRGAVFPALAQLKLSPAAVRRAVAALSYGRFVFADLLADWNQLVKKEGRFFANEYAGWRPVACDTTGFFRPELLGCRSKHYTGDAKTALPAVVLGLIASVGTVCGVRVPVLRHLLRGHNTKECEADLKRRLLSQASKTLTEKEVLVADAGFGLADVLASGVKKFVVRVAQNFTARKNALPEYKGRGRHPEYGEVVRPLPRTRKGKTIAADKPTQTERWTFQGRKLQAQRFGGLTLKTEKPGGASFDCVVIFDPRYKHPLVLATNLSVSAHVIWQLYRDRWAIEQLPLAAKVMLGGERAYVHGGESRFRLPELALLAGNVLSYVAAGSEAVSSGFWDRAARPTCGRLRRLLWRQDFSLLPVCEGKMRKKNSVTSHLKTGVDAHRRTKTRSGNSFTGN